MASSIESASLAVIRSVNHQHESLMVSPPVYTGGHSVTLRSNGDPHPGRPYTSGSTAPRHEKSSAGRSFRHVPAKGVFKVIKAAISDLFMSRKYVSSFTAISKAIDHQKNDVNPASINELKKNCSLRAAEIIDKCQPGSCLVFDFSDGRHSAMLICPVSGEPRYFSFGSEHLKWKLISENLGWNIEKDADESDSRFELRKSIIKDIVDHYDCVADHSIVSVTGLDCEKMLRKSLKIYENSQYSKLFNCSTFVADVLKSGYKHIHKPFNNKRRLQTPENTKKLARELQYINTRSVENNSDALLEKEIDQCSDIESARRLYESNVVDVKNSLRFRLRHFLLSLLHFENSEKYRITQLEKYIARHIMGSDAVKCALFKELKNEQGNDEQVKKLLSLLRLDSESVERVIKLNDPELFNFYMQYFHEDVNRRINKRKETMMLCAVRNQSNNIVRALWEKADKSLCDKDGNTLLILAAKKGNEEVVKMQWGEKPDTGETNKYGKTALDMARKYHHLKVVKLLEKRLVENTPL